MCNFMTPEHWVALFGAAATSILTVTIAFITYILEKHAKERQVLRRLIDDIHHRRAVGPNINVRYVPNAEQLADFGWANQSVLDIRERVAQAREKVRVKSPARKPLARMTKSCNQYLELSARDPNNYVYQLMYLRAELWHNIQEIGQQYLTIKPLEPGEASL